MYLGKSVKLLPPELLFLAKICPVPNRLSASTLSALPGSLQCSPDRFIAGSGERPLGKRIDGKGKRKRKNLREEREREEGGEEGGKKR